MWTAVYYAVRVEIMADTADADNIVIHWSNSHSQGGAGDGGATVHI